VAYKIIFVLDYISGETPPEGPGHEFHFDDFFCDATDEIGATQLTGAPLIGAEPTQEQHATMREDFNDTTQRAVEALAAAEPVEAEARVDRRGSSCLDQLLP
jgi:hypothetical protein